VQESLKHLQARRQQRQLQLKPRLEQEEQRLARWRDRRLSKLDALLAELPPNSRQANAYRQEKDEVQRFLEDRRENWRHAHFEAAPEPTTRLILAIEGV
jgi:hypothetical protein